MRLICRIFTSFVGSNRKYSIFLERYLLNTLSYIIFETSKPTLFGLSKIRVEYSYSFKREQRRKAISRKVIWCLVEVGNMGETLHNVKASLMLCQLVVWNLGNFNWWSRTKSEVAVTGMLSLYPRVCSEGILYPHAHFSGGTCIYQRRQTLYTSITKGLRGSQTRTSRDGCPRFLFCS